jgi:germacradienol/geosmin synthase
MSLCRLRHEGELPAGLCASGPLRALENAAMDYACLLNDLFSYQKEIEYEGEIHNAVLVVQTFFDCDYPTAFAMTADLMSSRLEQFLHVKERELPVMCDEFGLDENGRAALASYVRELEDWLAGILNWHRKVRRYKEEDLRGGAAPWRLGASTGFGTSAARISLPAQRSAVRV